MPGKVTVSLIITLFIPSEEYAKPLLQIELGVHRNERPVDMTKMDASRRIRDIRVRLDLVPDQSFTGRLHSDRVCGGNPPVLIARIQDLAGARVGLAFAATDGDAFGVLHVVEVDEAFRCRGVVFLPYILRRPRRRLVAESQHHPCAVVGCYLTADFSSEKVLAHPFGIEAVPVEEFIVVDEDGSVAPFD